MAKTFINVYYMKASFKNEGKYFKRIPVKSIEVPEASAHDKISTVKKCMGFKPILTQRQLEDISGSGFFPFIENEKVEPENYLRS